MNGAGADRGSAPIVNLRDAYLIEVYLHRANSHRDPLPSPRDPVSSAPAPAHLAHRPRRTGPPLGSPVPT